MSLLARMGWACQNWREAQRMSKKTCCKWFLSEEGSSKVANIILIAMDEKIALDVTFFANIKKNHLYQEL